MNEKTMNDIKTFYKSIGELNCLAERGCKFDEMYDEGYFEYLDNLCEEYNVQPLNRKNIEYEWGNEILSCEGRIEKVFTKIMMEGVDSQ